VPLTPIPLPFTAEFSGCFVVPISVTLYKSYQPRKIVSTKKRE